jgi:macrolide transport system ATP-binding/permease protein
MFSDLLFRIRALFRRKAVENELDQELQFHVEQQVEKYLRAGLTREEAERRTRLEFGALGRVKEDCRESRGITLVETTIQDIRYALRIFRRNPGFTSVVVLTLALGIGANTAIFSLINAVLLKMLPVRDPGQLVQFNIAIPGLGTNDVLPYPAFKHFRDESDAFSGIFAFAFIRNVDFEVGGQGGTASGQVVSGEYFSTLGVRPMLGRMISPQDDKVAGGSAVAVIGYDYWRSRFAGDPGAVGKTVVLDNYPFTVIGVTPPEFFGLQPGERIDVSVPITMIAQIRPGYAATGTQYDVMTCPFRNWLRIMGRLGPGVTNQVAIAHTASAFRQAVSEGAQGLATSPLNSPIAQQAYRQATLQLTSGGKGLAALRQRFSRPLTILMAAVGLLLLITCANVAGLLLARANAREREIAARLVLGASRLRLIRQLTTESILLALCGGGLGLVLAYIASGSLLAVVSQGRSPIILSARPDLRVLGFTLLVSLGTALLFGLIPAWRAARVDLPPSLMQSTHSSVRGGARSRLGGALIVLQIAVSLVLMMGAGLLARSLRNLKEFYPGFNKDNLLLVSVNPGMVGYKEPQANALYRTLIDRIDRLPGVRAISFSMDAPLSGGSSFVVPKVDGYRPPSGREATRTGLNIVGPRYFSALETPIYLGREFTAADKSGAPKVAIIDQSMARYYYGDTNPIGRRISIPGWIGDTSWLEIVGVVADARNHDLREEPMPMVYLPLDQSSVPSGVTFVIRTEKDPAAATTAVLRTIAEADRRLPVFGVRTFDQQLEDSLVEERLVASLSGMFGLLAVVLACVGLYGLMAYAVNRRTNEIGLRMALGARREQIAGMILAESLLLVLTGLAIGVPCALGAARLIRSELYGLNPADPTILLISLVVAVGVAVLAGYLPARRAMRIDPMVALRYE